MKASLIPIEGGEPIVLVKDVTVIGRKELCDVQIDEPSVSKVHLIVAKTDGLLLFRDMASTNGTKVNGQRVIRGALLPNDKIQIAAVKYQVQLLPDEPTTNPGMAEQATPPSEDAPVVRVFRAQELALKKSGKLPKQADPAVVETAEDDAAVPPPAPNALGPANSPRDPSAGAAGSAAQFVD